MARPTKENVEYFPFYCKSGKAMYYIENKYKNDGFAVWVKILRELALTNNHYLDLSEEIQVMHLTAVCNVSEELLNNIVSDLVRLTEFNEEVWNEFKVIWSDKFIDSIQDAYKNRKNKCMTFDGLYSHLLSLHGKKPTSKRIKPANNTQSKVKESKVNKSKVNDFIKKSIDFLNNELGTNYTTKPEEVNKNLLKIEKAKYTLEDIKKVVLSKNKEWKNDNEKKYLLRPSTLFRFSNFEKYLDESKNINPIKQKFKDPIKRVNI